MKSIKSVLALSSLTDLKAYRSPKGTNFTIFLDKADLSGTHFVRRIRTATVRHPTTTRNISCISCRTSSTGRGSRTSSKANGPDPSHYTCPSCNTAIVTRVERVSTTKTHLFAALLCLIGCWPCVCIPYCTNSCQNAEHYCPNCSAYIGNYSS
uniref:LITAF domain-containing protein n=1 Tax=Bombyx mori TaxID=7091 RepID=A0A8R2MAE3_BOMMO|nr:cell death-inducing p53-target protein 1-like [Bombyx mori]